jgi:hypothetical protein
LLEQERSRADGYHDHVLQLQSDAQETTKLTQQSQSMVKELTEKCREQVRVKW